MFFYPFDNTTKSKQKNFLAPGGAPSTRGPSGGAGVPGVAVTPLRVFRTDLTADDYDVYDQERPQDFG